MDAKRVLKQVGSLLKGLSITRFYKRNVSSRVTLLPGTELRPVSFNKLQQNKEAIFQKHLRRVDVAQFPIREPLFPASVFVFKMQIMLSLHDREF